jgi:hypothetical protein
VTGYDVRKGDATLNVMIYSHLYHKFLLEKFGKKSKDDGYLLTAEEIEFFSEDKDCPFVSIECPRGSMVLWDSRTIHSGRQPLKGRKEPNFRNIAYICMTPRKFADEKVLERKREVFEQLRVTTHWPHKVKMFPKTQRTYGKEFPPTTKILTMPKLSVLGFRLAGYDTNLMEYV